MFAWIREIEESVRDLAAILPLEVFVVVGSFVEEVVGPIPSTVVMATAGVFARLEDRTLLFVLWLAVLGALGKTLGAWIYYVLGDKLEDVVVRRFGRYLGVRHEDIESIGARFGKNHWRDGGLLLALRLIPFFPSTAISIACGVIRINQSVYLAVTWLGSFGKDLVYAYSGYAGVTALQRMWHDADRVRLGIDALLWIGLVAGGVSLYIHRERGARALAWLVEWARGR
jgi:membrane protein DedA with SNARE-associated domain